MEAQLIPLSIGPEKQINIFVHGYGAAKTPKDLEAFAAYVLAARPAGRVYLMFWKSGSWKFPPWVGLLISAAARAGTRSNPAAAAIGMTVEGLAHVVHFKWSEAKAEALGERFMVHLSKIPFVRKYPVNLIGFSLGARVIHYALATYDCAKYRLQDVVLLGGAADADDEDWPACADKVRGKIYAAWSPDDRILLMKPDTRPPVGRHGILWRHPKIVNRRYLLGHREYWMNLEYILARLWPRFRQAKQSLLATDAKCPYCGEAIVLEADDDYQCPTCNLVFRFDGNDVYFVENLVRCATRGCGYEEGLILEPDYTYSCPECDTALWQYGTIMR